MLTYDRLDVQAGLAPSRSFARLAALRAAPGSLIVVEPEHVHSFLRQYPTKRLAELGFSSECLEQLQLFGYKRLAAAQVLSQRHLWGQFGEEGARLYALLHPDEEPPVALFKPPPVITAACTFDPPCSEPRELLPALEHLLQEASLQLGVCSCQRVRVSLQLHRRAHGPLSCRILPEPVRSARRLLQTAKTLLFDVLAPGQEVEGLTLELGALREAAPRQTSLFFERPSLYEVVEAVHRRFPGAILRARTVPHVLFHEEEVRFGPFPEAPEQRRRSKGICRLASKGCL